MRRRPSCQGWAPGTFPFGLICQHWGLLALHSRRIFLLFLIDQFVPSWTPCYLPTVPYLRSLSAGIKELCPLRGSTWPCLRGGEVGGQSLRSPEECARLAHGPRPPSPYGHRAHTASGCHVRCESVAWSAVVGRSVSGISIFQVPVPAFCVCPKWPRRVCRLTSGRPNGAGQLGATPRPAPSCPVVMSKLYVTELDPRSSIVDTVHCRGWGVSITVLTRCGNLFKRLS